MDKIKIETKQNEYKTINDEVEKEYYTQPPRITLSDKGKRGKFIVFEGCDRSGKTTQSEKLYNYLTEEKINIKRIAFPGIPLS